MDKSINCCKSNSCTDVAKALQKIATSTELVGASLDKMVSIITAVSEMSQD